MKINEIKQLTKALILPTILLVCIAILTFIPGAESLSGWSSTRQIDISGSEGTLTNYSLMINLTYASGMDADFDDIRFTTADDTNVSYWIEESETSAYAIVWLKIPSIPSAGTVINLHYGNIAAASESDGKETFYFFDNFTMDAQYPIISDKGRTSSLYPGIPPALYSSSVNKTYVVFQGIDHDPYVMEYNHTAADWSTQILAGDNPMSSTDDHGAPALLRDSQGSLHVFYGCHNSYIQHAKSLNPDNIMSWTDKGNIGTNAATYPFPVLHGTDIYLFYREHVASLDKPVVYIKSTDHGESWGSVVPLINFTGTSNRIYHGGFELIGDQIHFSYMRATGDDSVRENVYYAYLNVTNGHVYNVTDSDMGTSVNWSESESYCKAFDSGGLWTSFTKAHCLDGVPHVLFTQGTGTDTQWCHTYYNGSYWVHDLNFTYSEKDYAHCDFILTSSSTIDAYLVVYAGDFARGGKIERWSYSSSTWGAVEVISPDFAFVPYNGVWVVRDYNDEIKVIFSVTRFEDHATPLPIYAWGSGGFSGEETLAYHLVDKWDNIGTDGPTNEDGGVITLTGGGGTLHFHFLTPVNLTYEYMSETRVKYDGGTSVKAGLYHWDTDNGTLDTDDQYSWLVSLSDTVSTLRCENNNTYTNVNTDAFPTDYEVLSISYNPGNLTYLRNYEYVDSLTTNVPDAGTMWPCMRQWAGGSTYWDWVRIREYVNGTQPVITMLTITPQLVSPIHGLSSAVTFMNLSVNITGSLGGHNATVTFYDASDDSEIGNTTCVSEGEITSVNWTGLSLYSSYSWYVIVNLTGYATETTSSTWSFITGTAPSDDSGSTSGGGLGGGSGGSSSSSGTDEGSYSIIIMAAAFSLMAAGAYVFFSMYDGAQQK